MNTTLSPLEIIRGWKDEEYRQSLSQAQIAQLPQHPAGMIELADAQLDTAAGGLHYRSATCQGCGRW